MKKRVPGTHSRARTHRRTVHKHYGVSAETGCSILGTSFVFLTSAVLDANHDPVLSMRQLRRESLSILSSK